MKGSGQGTLTLQETLLTLEQGLLPQPSIEGFARSLIKGKGERTHALRVCAYVYKGGLESDTSLANCLVSLLVEVVSIHDAQQVFDKLLHQNEESLGSFITGYVKCGRLHHALQLYQKIQHNDVVSRLSSHTFVALLKACKKLKDLKRGSEIHVQIMCARWLKKDLYVGSALIDMYASFGLLIKAQQVFEELPNRNVVVWTALIAGYTEHGHNDKSLKIFEQMQMESVSPNAVTIVCILKVCGNTRNVTKGQDIHIEIERRGLLESNLFVGSALVDMYSKCGFLLKAQQVFDKLPARDVVSWTALITGYTENGYGKEALKCFELMQHNGFAPNARTFACSLKACDSIRAIDEAKEIHAQIEKQGLLKRDDLLGSILVDIYAKNGLLEKAKQVFDKLSIRDVISWTSLIEGYTEHGDGQEALRCFNQMQQEGVVPDAHALICSLKACSLTQAKDKVREIHHEIKRQGLLKKDVVVGNTLLDTYAKCGLLTTARRVFEELPFQDVYSWNTLIAGYSEQGFHEEVLKCFESMKLKGVAPDTCTYVCTLKACSSMEDIDMIEKVVAEAEERGFLENNFFAISTLVDLHAKCGSLLKAQQVFDRAPVRDVVMWNALIAGHAQRGKGEQALSCLDQMQLEGVSPNAVTFLCLLKACGNMGAASKGQELHMEVDRRGLLDAEHVGNTLVDMYVKCGLLGKAQQVLNKLQSKDVVSWTTLMTGYTRCGDDENAFHVFGTMLGEGIKPNMVTFVVVLNACSRKGMFNKSETYFEAMSKDFGVDPALEHYNCMVDLLSRSGHVGRAVDLIRRKQIPPNLVMYRALLGACRSSGNVELGKQVFEQAVCLDAKNAAAYVLMSQVFAGVGSQGKA